MPHSSDPVADLKVVQDLRKKARRRRQYSSRLDPVRSYIEGRRSTGDSYRDIAWSLQIFYRIKVDHSTIKRAVDRWKVDAENP